MFCPRLHTVSIKGCLSGWTDSSVFLFLSVLILFNSRICRCHFHEAWPSPRPFHFFLCSQAGPFFPTFRQPQLQALRCRVRGCWSDLSVQLLSSCSSSGAPVQVSPILLPPALSETQPKTHKGHLPTHNSALPWMKLLILPFLTCFSGCSYPLNTVIFQTVIHKVHRVSATASEPKIFICLIFVG